MKTFDATYIRFLTLFALVSLIFFLLFIIVLQKNKSQKTILAEVARSGENYSLEFRPDRNKK